MVSGIILAGGTSSRMTTNKLLMVLAGKPMIMHTIEAIRKVVDMPIVVTGRFHEEIKAALEGQTDIQIVHNPEYAKGMFTSIKAGVKAAEGDFFIIPGDYPLVKSSTYETLVAASGPVRVPVYEGRRGHPLFFTADLKTKLLSEPDDANLKSFRDRFQITNVPVADEGVILDIDTTADMLVVENKIMGRAKH